MSSLRTAAKRVVARLPWHARRTLVTAVENWRGRKPAFAGVYASFGELKTTARSVEHELAASARQGALASRRSDDEGGLRRLPRAHSLLPLATALLGIGNRPVRILDFGGAAGVDFGNLLAALGHAAAVQYCVVDLPAVCDIGREVWADDDRITFSPELPSVTESFDVVYAWGALHYLADPLDVLGRFAAYRPQAILIVGSPVAESAFVRGQVNRSVPLPQWVLGLADCECKLAELGYELAFRAAGEDDYNVDNFAPPHRVPNGASLLFRRRAP